MENKNKNAPGCVGNKKKESQEEKQEEYISKKASKSITIARSLDSSGNPPKSITVKNDKPKGEKDGKSIFVIGNSKIKLLNGCKMSKKVNTNCKVFVKTFSGS